MLTYRKDFRLQVNRAAFTYHDTDARLGCVLDQPIETDLDARSLPRL